MRFFKCDVCGIETRASGIKKMSVDVTVARDISIEIIFKDKDWCKQCRRKALSDIAQMIREKFKKEIVKPKSVKAA